MDQQIQKLSNTPNINQDLPAKKKINWLFIIIVAVVAMGATGGILAYQKWLPIEENPTTLLIPTHNAIASPSAASELAVGDIPINKMDFSTRSIFYSDINGLYAVDSKTFKKTLISDQNFSPANEKIVEGSTLSQSHDFTKVAYIDKKGNLWVSDSLGNKVLLTADNITKLLNAKLENGANIIGCEGWSLDDTKLLFKMGEQFSPEGGHAYVELPTDEFLGFYVADFNTNKIYHLNIGDKKDYKNLEDFMNETPFNYEGWLDNDSILFSKKDENYHPSLYVYDLTSSAISVFGRFGVEQQLNVFGQFNAVKNNLYAYLVGSINQQQPSFGAIYFYNGQEPLLIKKGDWGNYQWPLISPDGKSISFEAKPNQLYLYNIATKQEQPLSIKQILPTDLVQPFYWFDNSSLLIEIRSADGGHASIVLYNTANQSSKTILN